MRYLFLFILLLTSLTAFSQSLTDTERTAIDQLVMADIPDGGPGAAVGIVRNGQIIYERYAGLADVENERPITAATRFNLASNAKQFTSVRALQLIDEGKLKLDDDIRKFFPELYPNLETSITIQQLINHTSGLRDVYDLWSIQGFTWWKYDFNNADALNLLRQQESLNFPPGTRHLYSNTNYILLAEIIAKVTGSSFKEDMDDFFSHLGMPSTSFREQTKVPVPDVARPYFNFDTWKTYELPATTHGDGALFGNLHDQLTWETSLQTRQSPVLTPTQLTRSQLPLDTITDYAYGLENDTYRDVAVRYHNGSTGAWKASTIRFPEESLTIVVLNNSGKFFTSYLARLIADAILFPGTGWVRHQRSPTTLGPKPVLNDLLGTYVINDDYYFRFVQRNDTLLLERPNREPVALEWETGNVYHEIADPDFKQAFTQAPSGEWEVTAYYPSHDPYSLTRVTCDWPSYDFTALEGTYRNEELGITGTIAYADNQTFTITAGENTRTVVMSVPDVLTYRGASLNMQRCEKGNITGFTYSTDRARNVLFKQVVE